MYVEGFPVEGGVRHEGRRGTSEKIRFFGGPPHFNQFFTTTLDDDASPNAGMSDQGFQAPRKVRRQASPAMGARARPRPVFLSQLLKRKGGGHGHLMGRGRPLFSFHIQGRLDLAQFEPQLPNTGRPLDHVRRARRRSLRSAPPATHVLQPLLQPPVRT
jgi:hypothetical protein